MKRTRLVRALAVLSAVTMIGTSLGDRATAAPRADSKAPMLWVVKSGAFVDGTIVNGVGFGSDPLSYYASMPFELKWGAKDRSGICGYSLEEVPTGAPPRMLFEGEMVTRHVVPGNEYNGDFGGGATLTAGWNVRATDCAGNTSAPAFIPNTPTSIQDDGNAATSAGGTVRFTGRWRVDECVCWSAGTTRKSWQGGARASYTAEFRKGEHVAVVMATGPNRGRARILVDGKPRSVIDTYSPAPGFRQVAWETWMSAGEHTITVVNLSTRGRRRIDVDAFLHSRR